MYELKVKDTTGIWHNLDLIPGEEPAMTYQVNDIAELKDRQADYSQKLNLPKTSTNLRVLERLDLFEANALTPYRTIECRLYSNGFALAGKGSLFVIDRVGEYIEGQIISGNAGLFYTMQNRLMEEADLGSIIVGSGVLPSWIKWANCINGKLGEEYKTGYYYFANLFQVASGIIGLCGYELICNLPDMSKNRDAISLASLKPWTDSLSMFNSQATFNSDGIIQSSAYEYNIAPLIVNSGSGTSTVFNTRLKYTSNIKGTVKIDLSCFGTIYSQMTTANYKIELEIVKNTELVKRIDIGVGGYSYDFSKDASEVVDVVENDILYIRVYIRQVVYTGINLRLTMTSTIVITEIEADYVPTAGRLYFGNNLGFTTYLDLFKTFCQTYGLTVYVDEDDKKVEAYTMDKLYENKTIAKDWSDKLSRENQEMSFIIDGYGQNNFIGFEKKEDLEDKGNFYVSNENLEKEKDLFTIKWESGEDKTKGENRLAVILLYEYSLDASTNLVRQEYKGTKPHLVRHSQINANPFFIVNHIPVQSLIDTYYYKLANRMLVNAKCLSVEMLLTERDIEELDFFTPIYLKQFGAYFYVSKINNFVAYDRLTKVDLIRL